MTNKKEISCNSIRFPLTLSVYFQIFLHKKKLVNKMNFNSKRLNINNEKKTKAYLFLKKIRFE